MRAAIGKAAHWGAWFKSVTKGQQWADAIAPHLDDTAFQTTPTGLKLRTLRAWIDRD